MERDEVRGGTLDPASEELITAARRALPRWRLAGVMSWALVWGAAALLGVGSVLAFAVGRGAASALLIDAGSVALAIGFAVWADHALRSWGARRVARRALIVPLGVLIALAAWPRLVGATLEGAAWWASFGVSEAALGVLYVAWWRAPVIARRTGQTAEWLALRERAAMWAAWHQAAGEEAKDAAISAGLARVEAHRTPATDEFIDALRAWYALPEPADPTVEAPALRRFRLAEFRLYLSLGAPPAWYRDFPWLDGATVAHNGFLLADRMRVSLA